jgi:hypothetical protein
MDRKVGMLIAMSVVIAAMSGCATYNPIPDGYAGPRATLRDSVVAHSHSKADFFYVQEVDGHQIEDSRTKTLQVNYGRGMYMTPQVVERQIPARASSLKLVGRTEYAAPILTLTNTVYQVTGDVQFTPAADKVYVVKGELGENYSAVWLEEFGVGPVAGTKVEVKGSAGLGILEK